MLPEFKFLEIFYIAKLAIGNSNYFLFFLIGSFIFFNFFNDLGIFLTISSAIKPGPNFLAISP